MIVLLQPHPALLIKAGETRTLVVADLHIGWEVTLTNQGVHVPSQTPKLLKRLLQLIDRYKPNTLVMLGDVKHTVATAQLEEWRDVPAFFEKLKRKIADIRVVPGNHDGNLAPLLPPDIEITPPTGITIQGVGLFHGHTWPAPKLLESRVLVMGHVHPVIAFRDPLGFRIIKQVWIKAKLNPSTLAEQILKKSAQQTGEKLKMKAKKLVIMPQFNDFLGGRPINEKPLEKKSEKIVGPILRSRSVDLENAEIYMLDGTYLGKIGEWRLRSGFRSSN
ncbi:phosphoesterase [Candidatus Bathyarchaeota archaeon]|nr:MAG: phosphoesterase [Candidatus Bathyarchaeota archaeon]